MSTDRDMPGAEDSAGVDETTHERLGNDSMRPAVDTTQPEEDGVLYEEQVKPEYGILGMTLRELLIVGAWALAFLVSFFPLAFHGTSVWGSGLGWILTIGVPTAAVFLIVLRRFSPDGIRRVGSLGIDQFASVAFSVGAVAWAQEVWARAAASIETGLYLVGWVPILQLLLMLALVAFTVAAPLIPGLREDFHGRLETLAHRNANPVRPVIARPRPATDAGGHAPAAPARAETGAAAPAVARPTTGFAPVAPAGPDAAARDAQETTVIPTGAVGEPFEAASSEAASSEAAISGAGASEGEPASAGEPVAASVPGPPAPASEPGQQAEEPVDAGAAAGSSPDGSPDEPGPSEPVAVAEASGADATASAPAEPDSTGTRPDEADSAGPRPDADRPDPEDPTLAFQTPVAQPFWILAPTERDVHDERGRPIFRIGPTAWALVIEDRGGAYVVRHDDGRIGFLHDISDVTKG
ncbi:hypothetical protein [Microbacterium sp. EF45047]|uniref:hypothetical protein n=1 Tax=Microbacterium sp. EF45047 TaxID=2809708 RepID=UPI00234B2BDF|nr:hypothetical protein [Microbacterium sp. EF45047]